MNENQQTQGYYKCNGGCLEGYLRPMPFSQVKGYCLDDGRGIRMKCVLCSSCSSYQFSRKQELGFFPLLATIMRSQEIKTPEFVRHLEEETRIKQEQERKHQQEFKTLFNCDKCFKSIRITEEQEYCFIKYFDNSSVVSDIEWHIFCPSCASGYTKNFGNLITDPKKTSIRTSLTFERYREYRERLRKDINIPKEER